MWLKSSETSWAVLLPKKYRRSQCCGGVWVKEFWFLIIWCSSISQGYISQLRFFWIKGLYIKEKKNTAWCKNALTLFSWLDVVLLGNDQALLSLTVVWLKCEYSLDLIILPGTHRDKKKRYSMPQIDLHKPNNLLLAGLQNGLFCPLATGATILYFWCQNVAFMH